MFKPQGWGGREALYRTKHVRATRCSSFAHVTWRIRRQPPECMTPGNPCLLPPGHLGPWGAVCPAWRPWSQRKCVCWGKWVCEIVAVVTCQSLSGLVCATLPRNVTEAGGIRDRLQGFPHPFQCRGTPSWLQGWGWGCLQWSSGPLCMSPSRRITASPLPLSPCPHAGRETTFPGTMAPGLRLAVARGPGATACVAPVVLPWCLGAEHAHQP